ncbi:MAG TPA: hypothetical protein VHQ90_14125 [Thermoanaerobaculia bacterium]|nr:hypothetical protein [Thermoanaerobaculia bacterium]
MRLESARVRLKKVRNDDRPAEGGHGPFRGLDAPFALRVSVAFLGAAGNGARAVESRFNTDLTDGAEPTLRCDCGATARYAGRRSKRFETVLGSLRLRRAYYHCALCGRGFCPRDRALGLAQGSLSPGVLHMIAQVGALVTFKEGSDLLAALAGVSLDAKHVERAAEGLGAEIANNEQRRVEPPPAGDPPKTFYLGMDGTGIPMRPSELLGRPGKQADGSAKTREAKLCAVWSAEGRDHQGLAVRDPARSATRQPSKVPPSAIPTTTIRPSPNALYSAP